MSRDSLHKDLMEDILLLYMLDQFPGSSQDNQQPQTNLVLPSSYQLPFHREKEIVDNLAFLSATTNDASRVTAVCLEEARGRDSCTIRLSSNDGSLNKELNGFRDMAKVLEQASLRVNNQDDDIKRLLRCIVTLHYLRISSRLRSRHATKSSKDKNKPALLQVLSTAVREIVPTSKVTVMELVAIRKQAIALEALFAKLEGIPEHFPLSSNAQEVVMDLITQMHDLTSEAKLKRALESSKNLDPGLKCSLPEAIKELGRYYSVSCELICAARNKEYSIFKSVAVEMTSVRCPPQPSQVDKKTLHPSTALQNVLRPKTVAQSRAIQSSLEARLSQTLKVIADDFRSNVADYYRSVKVHAEIQLLFFYELNPGRPRPRIVCSSKSACYLCNLFFKLHGQFHIPRTHGRLFHRWTLPDWSNLLPEIRRRDFNALFNQLQCALRSQIKAALEKKPVQANRPSESSLVVSNSSAIAKLPEMLDHHIPNNGSIPLDISTSSDITNSGPLLSPPPKLLTSTTSPSSALITYPRAPESFPLKDSVTSDPYVESSLPSSHTSPSSPPISTPRLTVQHDLTDGEPVHRRIPYPNISISIGDTRLNLQFSGDTILSHNPTSCCRAQVKWFQGTNMANVNPQAADTESLIYNTEMRFGHGVASTPTELHLRHGQDCVSISYALDELRSE